MSEGVKQTRSKAGGRPFQKGQPGGPGRPAGSVNRATQEFRETVRQLLEDNAQNVQTWLDQVANGHSGKPGAPEKALDLLARLAEFAAPKLARVEHTGENGGPLKVQRVERAVIDAGPGELPGR